jgi:hypothetical protein
MDDPQPAIETRCVIGRRLHRRPHGGPNADASKMHRSRDDYEQESEPLDFHFIVSPQDRQVDADI